jgi:hypothetical protein
MARKEAKNNEQAFRGAESSILETLIVPQLVKKIWCSLMIFYD